jgi:hypothetical protein
MGEPGAAGPVGEGDAEAYRLVLQCFAKPMGVATPVGDHPFGRGQSARLVADLPGGHEDRPWPSLGVGGGLQAGDLGARRPPDQDGHVLDARRGKPSVIPAGTPILAAARQPEALRLLASTAPKGCNASSAANRPATRRTTASHCG